jgi:hypothetical protein
VVEGASESLLRPVWGDADAEDEDESDLEFDACKVQLQPREEADRLLDEARQWTGEAQQCEEEEEEEAITVAVKEEEEEEATGHSLEEQLNEALAKNALLEECLKEILWER